MWLCNSVYSSALVSKTDRIWRGLFCCWQESALYYQELNVFFEFWTCYQSGTVVSLDAKPFGNRSDRVLCFLGLFFGWDPRKKRRRGWRIGLWSSRNIWQQQRRRKVINKKKIFLGDLKKISTKNRSRLTPQINQKRGEKMGHFWSCGIFWPVTKTTGKIWETDRLKIQFGREGKNLWNTNIFHRSSRKIRFGYSENCRRKNPQMNEKRSCKIKRKSNLGQWNPKI